MEKALTWARYEDKWFRGSRKVAVIGVGDCGINMLNHLKNSGLNGVEYIAINTDLNQLRETCAEQKVLIGRKVTKGRGANNHPDLGRAAILESLYEIRSVIKGHDIIFVVAGLGGGTGTGAAPVIAEYAKMQGAVVIGIVTVPLRQEKERYDHAMRGIEEMKRSTHTTVVLDNNKLAVKSNYVTVSGFASESDDHLTDTVKSVVETVTMPNLVNLDFGDFYKLLNAGDIAAVGTGTSAAGDKPVNAAYAALNNLMMDVNIKDCMGALINIYGSDIDYEDVLKVVEVFSDRMRDDVTIQWNSRIVETLGDSVQVNVILTGIRNPTFAGGYGTVFSLSKDVNCVDLGVDMYNMENFTTPDVYIDLGIDLPDMEAGFKHLL